MINLTNAAICSSVLILVGGATAAGGSLNVASRVSDDSHLLTPSEDITINRESQRVKLRAWVCLEEGFLEQIACSPGTREHESLVVIRATPSDIHAAMLLAGFEPGTPGRWIYHPEKEKVELVEPRGPELDILVRYEDSNGEQVERPVRTWIREHENHTPFPDKPWVFGGSMFRENPEFMGPGEHYVADMTGSIIGLVTFGDEVIGLKQVISDQAAIHEPEWEVNPDAIPAEGTQVTLIIQPRATPADEGDAQDDDASEGDDATRAES